MGDRQALRLATMYGKELSHAFMYYGKNMMNGAGKSIYKELGKAFARSGLTGLSTNSAKAIYSRYNL